jgi:site-specific DNA-methyltransferase (cytosine-N4-specific)
MTEAVYSTRLGAAYCGDALDLLAEMPDESVQAIITSPPYALLTKKAYGNQPQHEYVEWFMRFAGEFRRVLREDGSLVLEIGGAWLPGNPTRSIYQYELLVALVSRGGFHLAEEFFWYNRAKIPGPAQWVNVERIRVKDSVTPIWWLGKGCRPKADNKRVLTPYSPSQERLMANGCNRAVHPSGHRVGGGFVVDNGGAIPPNLIQVANTRSNDGYQRHCKERRLPVHPARFPREVPEFFIKFLTEPGDMICDPFAGSNTTGYCADKLGRRWLAFDMELDYLLGSQGRWIADGKSELIRYKEGE